MKYKFPQSLNLSTSHSLKVYSYGNHCFKIYFTFVYFNKIYLSLLTIFNHISAGSLKKLSKKGKQNLELGIIALIVIITIMLWNTIAIYPVKLFVVLLHEISHGIVSVLSGGQIISIQISENLGGQCLTKGGIPFLVASAGYLGSLIFGSAIFISSYDIKYGKWITTFIAVILLLFTANFMTGSIGIILSLLFVLILFLSPRYFNKTVHKYLMKSLGLISSLYVLVDIKEDLITFAYRESDAHLLAKLTGISAIFWGVLWFIISAIVIYFLFRFGYKKGYKK